MQIEKQIGDLDKEIAELHIYVSMRTEEERNRRLEKISELGAVFLPPALLAGVLGINSGSFLQNGTALFVSLAAIVISGVLGFAMLKSRRKKLFGALLLSVMLAVPIGLQYAKDAAQKSGQPIPTLKEKR